MADKEPQFTVTDRRKFTLDGSLRPGAESSESNTPPPAAHSPAASSAVPAAPVVSPAPSPQAAVAPPITDAIFEDDFAVAEGNDEDLLPEPTAEESADQHAAYRESTRTLDDLIAKQNPRARSTGEMTFDKVVQSIYMTAAIQLGAGAQPGEQPRVDIMGARQSIDMLSVLTEKTKGNLTPDEARLLQNALFELRMTFLEITNAIASQAQKPQTPAMGSAMPGGRSGFGGIKPGGLR